MWSNRGNPSFLGITNICGCKVAAISQMKCLEQFANLSEMQIQMIYVASNHCVESHSAALVVNPIVVELGAVGRTDDVADVLVV